MMTFRPYRVIALVIASASLSACSYNKFVELEQSVKTEWGEVQSELQQRNDLIPGLIEAVKSHASPQEQPVFQGLADSHARLAAARTPEEMIRAANEQSAALVRLSALVEHNPELKGNASFKQLTDQLAGSELRISVERMRYNARVQQYNTSRREFPGGLTAGLLNFPDYPFFDVPPPVPDRAK